MATNLRTKFYAPRTTQHVDEPALGIRPMLTPMTMPVLSLVNPAQLKPIDSIS